jgi:hypothetical protein
MPDPGSSYVTYSVRLSRALDAPVDVAWRTQAGTAVPGTDYEDASGTLTFAAGDTAKSIQVLVYGRDPGDTDERTFSILVIPPPDILLRDGAAQCIITVIDADDATVTSVVVANGPNGTSAYDLAKLQGFTGTADEWLASLKADAIADTLDAAARAQTSAGTASAQAGIASAQTAIAIAKAAEAENSAGVASFAKNYWPGARAFVPQGVVDSIITSSGAGGTAGTYPLAFSGGNLSIQPLATFTVANGGLVSIDGLADSTGLYLGASIDAPDPDFSACPGLAGADATLKTGFLIGSGHYYATTHATDPLKASLFVNNAGAALQVTADFAPLDAYLARDWAQSETAPDPADPTSKSAKTIAGELAASVETIAELAASLGQLQTVTPLSTPTGQYFRASDGAPIASASYDSKVYAGSDGDIVFVSSVISTTNLALAVFYSSASVYDHTTFISSYLVGQGPVTPFDRERIICPDGTLAYAISYLHAGAHGEAIVETVEDDASITPHLAADVGDLKQKVQALGIYVDMEPTWTAGIYYSIDDGRSAANANYAGYKVGVSPGDNLRISKFSENANTTAAIIYLDDAGTPIGHYAQGTGVPVTVNASVTVPDGAAWACFTTRVQALGSVKIEKVTFASHALADAVDQVSENTADIEDIDEQVTAASAFNPVALGTIETGFYYNYSTGVKTAGSANFNTNAAFFAVKPGQLCIFNGTTRGGATSSAGIVFYDNSDVFQSSMFRAGATDTVYDDTTGAFTVPDGVFAVKVTNYGAVPVLKRFGLSTAGSLAPADKAKLDRLATVNDRAAGAAIGGVGTSIPANAPAGGKTYWQQWAEALGCTIDNKAVSTSSMRAGRGSNKATATATFASQPADGDTITPNGHVLTFRTAPAVAGDVPIGRTFSDTAIALASYINANHATLGVSAFVLAGVVTIISDVRGTAGNAVTIAESSAAITLSAATLSGGHNASGAVVVGSITSSVLTVTQVLTGSIGAAMPLSPAFVSAGTTIAAQTGGTTGGVGTYTLANAGAIADVAAGTTIFIGDDPLGWSGVDYQLVQRTIGHTLGEKAELTENWAKWASAGRLSGSPPPTLSGTDVANINSWSFESRILPNLATWKKLIWSHGYNDDNWTGHVGEVADVPVDSRDRTTTIGSFNWLMDRISSYCELTDQIRMPDIIVECHYENHKYPAIVAMQEYLAGLWNFSSIPLYKHLKLSQQLISVTGQWSAVPGEWQFTGGSPRQITMLDRYISGDGLHPHNDNSGTATLDVAQAGLPYVRDFLRAV